MKSLEFAARLLPKETRKAVKTLYAFFREGKMTEEAAEVFKVYEIPREYPEDFIKARAAHSEGKTYASYEALERYMYGTAAVPAIILTYVIGFTDKRALLYAEELGYAIQLTIFLRDLRKDFEQGRMYLPQNELASFGITSDNLSHHICDEKFSRFMGFQMSRARALYVSADEGVSLLKPEAQLAVRVASTLYEAVLDKIDEVDYDVFGARVETNLLENIFLAYGVWKHSKTGSPEGTAG